MASYGFGFNNKGWNESKKAVLTIALGGVRPCVLVDEPSMGVNLREPITAETSKITRTLEDGAGI
ncbi:MAG: hypothetical protein ACRD8Z_02230 [Nitrososphaeraceae archaeon]